MKDSQKKRQYMKEVLVIHNVWHLLFSSAKLALGTCHSVQLTNINSNRSARDNSWYTFVEKKGKNSISNWNKIL